MSTFRRVSEFDSLGPDQRLHPLRWAGLVVGLQGMVHSDKQIMQAALAGDQVVTICYLINDVLLFDP